MNVKITVWNKPSWRNLWSPRDRILTKDGISDWAEVQDVADKLRGVFDFVEVREMR